MQIAYGVNVTGEAQAAFMRETFDREIIDQSALQTGRIYGQVDFSRPFKLGIVNFVPHLGTQQAAYDRSRNEGSVTQGALTYGLDATTRFYGTFSDFENEALGIKGLRHIIEPRISYSAVGETRENPTDLYDFDQVDDLQRLATATISLTQHFQTPVPH